VGTIVRGAVAALFLALALSGPVVAAAPADYQGMAYATCDSYTGGYDLEWGAFNPTDHPIEIRLFYEGQDTGVAPLVAQPNHGPHAIVAFDRGHDVQVVADGIYVFDAHVPLPTCESTWTPQPNITLPPTATVAPDAPAAPVDLAPLFGLTAVAWLVILAGGRRRWSGRGA
jgi:hypothetical protein